MHVRGEGRVLGGVQRHATHALLVVCQRAVAPACNQVPQFDLAVVAASDDLGVGGLGEDGAHGVAVSRQNVDAVLGADVPHPGTGVA